MLCGSSSAMSFACCVGRHLSTSFKKAYEPCPLSRADGIRLSIAAARWPLLSDVYFCSKAALDRTSASGRLLPFLTGRIRPIAAFGEGLQSTQRRPSASETADIHCAERRNKRRLAAPVRRDCAKRKRPSARLIVWLVGVFSNARSYSPLTFEAHS